MLISAHSGGKADSPGQTLVGKTPIGSSGGFAGVAGTRGCRRLTPPKARLRAGKRLCGSKTTRRFIPGSGEGILITEFSSCTFPLPRNVRFGETPVPTSVHRSRALQQRFWVGRCD